MIIRSTRQNIADTIPSLVFPAPGGNWSWQCVRISNYSPWLVALNGILDGFNEPTCHILPWQQNRYQYGATQGAVVATIEYNDTASPTGIVPFILVEYADTWEAFHGTYPSPLVPLVNAT